MAAAASQNARNKTRNTNTNKKATNETKGKTKKKKQSATPTRGSARTRRESRSNNAAGKRRRKSPGIRVIRGRIHDSHNGNTCHQELAVASTRGCKRGRSCLDIKSDSELESKTLKLNEQEKEIPNGKLKRTRSVGLNDNVTDGNKGDTAFKKKTCLKRCQITKEIPAGEEKACGRGDAIQSKKGRSNKQGLRKTHTRPYKIEDNKTRKSNEDEAIRKQVTGFHKRQKTAEVRTNGSDADISLPQGIELTNVADFDLPAEDVGHALQLIEFCEAFGKVLDLKKGQPGYLLQELVCGRSSHGILQSPIVGLHIKLLSMIQNDSGKEYVSVNLRNFTGLVIPKTISLQDRSKELSSDCSNFATDEYGDLSPSMKLRLLNFLCDEALGTAELRRWINEQNSEFAEEKRKSKEIFLAERKKERNMKMKLQDEMARAIVVKNGPPLSISEHQDLVLKIKAEVSQTLVENFEAKYLEIKKKQRSHAVRLEPLLFDGNGRKFWNLRSHSSERDVLLQDGLAIMLRKGKLSKNMFQGSLEDEKEKSSISSQPFTPLYCSVLYTLFWRSFLSLYFCSVLYTLFWQGFLCVLFGWGC
ncbi:uncharacterized protein LOC127789880 isoform X2 [Diospyros lotus]|uniref:uncharacterized protein LOC127789880 isoform X2 n=1 Tax=Diospyros lotus TaxID=55363 RepID=UPI00224EB662|nr:uncharacterized protein LOC127789880 isoform X2 [Diospyros lotus]